jgi:hypothetical protein
MEVRVYDRPEPRAGRKNPGIRHDRTAPRAGTRPQLQNFNNFLEFLSHTGIKASDEKTRENARDAFTKRKTCGIL